MFTRILLPLTALLGIAAGIGAIYARKPQPVSRPMLDPPQQPASGERFIAGAGLIEAQRENIPVGTVVPGVVMEVNVDGRPGHSPPHKKVGDRVSRGEPLFRIDDRDLKAELKVRESGLQAADAQLRRLTQMPRPEDVPPALQAVEEARARLLDAQAAFTRDEQLFQKRMLAASDFDKDRYALQAARATLSRTEADLAKLKAGSWTEDVQVQKAAVELARSQVESIKIGLERLVVRSPVDGRILQVNVRPGQFAALAWKEPMIVIGEVNRLHVRVDVDENDLYRFREGAAARATLKGRREPEFPLEFVRIEPYVIPKRSLTGDNSERVDTRVLQVLYALPDQPPTRVFVGQQMDVFIVVDSSPGSVTEAAPGAPAEAGGPAAVR